MFFWYMIFCFVLCQNNFAMNGNPVCICLNMINIWIMFGKILQIIFIKLRNNISLCACLYVSWYWMHYLLFFWAVMVFSITIFNHDYFWNYIIVQFSTVFITISFKIVRKLKRWHLCWGLFIIFCFGWLRQSKARLSIFKCVCVLIFFVYWFWCYETNFKWHHALLQAMYFFFV